MIRFETLCIILSLVFLVVCCLGSIRLITGVFVFGGILIIVLAIYWLLQHHQFILGVRKYPIEEVRPGVYLALTKTPYVCSRGKQVVEIDYMQQWYFINGAKWTKVIYE